MHRIATVGKRFGNVSGDQGASSVALDSKGNTIISGLLSGAVDFGTGVTTTGAAYLTKLDPAGSTVFSKPLPIGGLMTVDASDNVVLVGHFGGSLDFGGGKLDTPGADNIYLTKLGPDGTHLLSKTIGHGTFTLYDVAAGPAGSVFIAGLIHGIVDLGGGTLGSGTAYSAFVARYDSNGDHVYSRRFGGVGNLGGALTQAIGVDAAGNAAIAAGIYGGLVDFGGIKLDSAAGGFAVAKLDPTGNVLVAKQFPGGPYAGLNAGLPDASMGVVIPGNYDIAVDPTGEVFLAGDFTGNVTLGITMLQNQGGKDIFVTKLDPVLSHLWSKSYGSFGDQIATHIAVDMFGNSVVTGTYPGDLDFPNQVHLFGGTSNQHTFGLKLDTNGGHLWALGSTGSAASKVASTNVAIGALGDVVFSGAAKDVFVFGMVPAQAGGFFDTYVAKLAP
jgi:hypothetical protein